MDMMEMADKVEFLHRRLERCDVILNDLLFEHGENEDLQAAAEHSKALLWHLEQLRKAGERGEEE